MNTLKLSNVKTLQYAFMLSIVAFLASCGSSADLPLAQGAQLPDPALAIHNEQLLSTHRVGTPLIRAQTQAN